MAQNRRKSKKKNNKGGDSLKFLVVILAALVVILVIYIIGRNNDKEKPDGPVASVTPIVFDTETPAPTPTKAEQSVATATPAPTLAPTEAPVEVTPEATPEVTVTPEVSQKPTATPTPTAIPKIDVETAEKTVKGKIDTALYSASLANDHLSIDGVDYYAFQVKNIETGKKFDELIVVNARNKDDVKILADSIITDFVKFPLDKAEAPGGNNTSGTITPEEAYKILCKYDKDSLNLAKAVSEYKYRTDGNITTINGTTQCYSIELYEITNGKERNRGTFYVSVDGLDVFYFDYETGKFMPVSLG